MACLVCPLLVWIRSDFDPKISFCTVGGECKVTLLLNLQYCLSVFRGGFSLLGVTLLLDSLVCTCSGLVSYLFLLGCKPASKKFYCNGFEENEREEIGLVCPYTNIFKFELDIIFLN